MEILLLIVGAIVLTAISFQIDNNRRAKRDRDVGPAMHGETPEDIRRDHDRL